MELSFDISSAMLGLINIYFKYGKNLACEHFNIHNNDY